MKNRPRVVLASLLAPFAVVLLPALLAIATVVSPEMVEIEPTDDAPIRSAGIILFVLIPLAYPILVGFMAGIGYVLLSVQKLSRSNLLVVSAVASLAFGIIFGLQSPFGIKDQIIGIVVFFFTSMLCLACGVFSWWHIVNKGESNHPHETFR